MKSKYLFLLSFFITALCSGMDPNRTTLDLLLKSTIPVPQFKTLSEAVNYKAPAPNLTLHWTANMPAVMQTASALQTISATERYNTFSQSIPKLTNNLREIYQQQLAKLSFEEAVDKIEELKRERAKLEREFEQKLLQATIEVQGLIRNGSDPLTITLPKENAELQKTCADLMIELKVRQIETEALKNGIVECQRLIDAHTAVALKDTIKYRSIKDLIEVDIPAMIAEIKKIELKITQSKGSELIKLQRELLINKEKLKYMQSVLKHKIEMQFTQQRMEDLKQLKENLINWQFDDIQLSKAVDKAIADNGTQKNTVYNMLRSPEESLLGELKIPTENFKKIFGDSLQQYLFNQTNSILYTTALANVQHKGNPELKELIDATAEMCYVAIKNIHTGTPQEATAALKFAESLQEYTNWFIIDGGKTPSLGNLLVEGSTDCIAQNLKSGLELIQAIPDVYQNPSKFMNELDALIKNIGNGLGIVAFQTMATLGEYDRLSSQVILDKAQMEKIVTSANELALTLDTTRKELWSMSGNQIAKKIGKEGTQIALNLGYCKVALKVAGAAGKLAVSQSKALFRKIKNSGAAITAAQNAIITAEEKLAAAIKAKSAEIVTEVTVAQEANSCLKNVSSVEFQKYWESLIRDSANGNKITMKSMEEAIAGIVSEQQGLLTGPLRRDPSGAAEFIDKFGQKWDVKLAISRAANGKYIFNPEHLLKKIKFELLIGENVVLDTTKLELADVPILYEKVIQNLTKSEINKIIVIIKNETLNNLK